MDNINVLMSVNKNFLEHARDMMFSVLFYSSRFVNLYLMYQEDELSEKDLNYISDFVSSTKKGKIIPIKFETHELSTLPTTLPDGSFVGKETYARLFIAFKLPKSVDKILYLDADIIATGDITELYDISFDNCSWVGTRDVGIDKNDLARLGLPSNYPYINAGVLLINVNKLKKNYEEIDIINLIKDNINVLDFLDQDFINKIFANDIKVIDSKYNLLVKSINYKDLKEMPLILHYAGSVKPWHDDVSRFDKEFMEPYYETLRLQGNDRKVILDDLLIKHGF